MTAAQDRRLGASFYGDARGHALDAEIRTRCTNAGVVNERDIQDAQAKARAEHAALWAENPDMTIEEDRELRAARGAPAIAPGAVAQRQAEIVESLRQPVYATRGAVEAVLAVEKASNRQRPILNGLLNATGAGNSVPLARLWLAARQDELRAASSTAAKKGWLG
jgi:hypothetical protein